MQALSSMATAAIALTMPMTVTSSIRLKPCCPLDRVVPTLDHRATGVPAWFSPIHPVEGASRCLAPDAKMPPLWLTAASVYGICHGCREFLLGKTYCGCTDQSLESACRQRLTGQGLWRPPIAGWRGPIRSCLGTVVAAVSPTTMSLSAGARHQTPRVTLARAPSGELPQA